ncbi:hypothetical protein RhiJN_23183 [Ceratobasidium sp. AG-Ba]|nr:hypothetical protein RhiJN_23183 [Ceratobasidium sp. AG-Ba]
MSGNTTPDSSRRSSSSEGFDSDTTPSPSGDRVHQFDPKFLSARLAFYQASRALSLASSTLSAASQAMSKAAESLVIASDQLAAMPQRGAAVPVEDHISVTPFTKPPVSGCEWQQTSYILPNGGSTTSNLQEESFTPGESAEHSGVQIPAALTEYNPNSTTYNMADDRPPTADASGVAGLFKEELDNPGIDSHESINAMKTEVSIGLDTSIYLNEHDETPTTKSDPTTILPLAVGEADDNTSLDPDTPRPEVPSGLNAFAPLVSTSGSTTDAMKRVVHSPVPSDLGPVSNHKKSSIVLDRGVDELPVVALLCQQYTQGKTVCFYNHQDVAVPLMSTLSFLAGQPVSMGGLGSTALTRTKGFRKFLDGNFKIATWPTDVELPQVATPNLMPKIQLIHIGEFSNLNADFECERSFVVTSTRRISSLAPSENDILFREYPADVLSQHCNSQGDSSLIEQTRQKIRGKLRKISYVEPFYKAFISHHRAHNPEWDACELVIRANEYAREHLLRGAPIGDGETLGDQIGLKLEEVEKWDLGSAVESGILSVRR